MESLDSKRAPAPRENAPLDESSEPPLPAAREGLAPRALLRAMRPHQWVKNLLVFAPVVFHHALFDPRMLWLGTLAFAAFCAVASAIYLLNDVCDVESDRRHPVKRFRPIASGRLPIGQAIGALGALLAGAAALSLALLPWAFSACLLVYVLMNLGYSFWLKQKVMIDILVLAGFYTLRIVAGGAATDIAPSEWLLALSMFLFLSLAFLKRFDELVRLRDEGELKTDNRGYHVGDIELLQTMGATCGYLAVLVLALYINSQQVVGLYTRPRLLWLVCPLLLYWVSRAWLWARRGAIREDPLLFALKDRISWLCLVLVAALAAASI